MKILHFVPIITGEKLHVRATYMNLTRKQEASDERWITER
jgi:hypothetical protein